MAGDPLQAGDAYLVKIGAQTVPATVEAVRRRVDLQTLESRPATMLEANDIGEVALALDRPVAFDAYRTSRQTGGFILIDRETYDTAGMGLVEEPAAAAERPSQAAGSWRRGSGPGAASPKPCPGGRPARSAPWRSPGSSPATQASPPPSGQRRWP
jgi:sulfate adenylyltransferase subunit 1 (EFTu-like GTPase family)